MRQDVEFPAHDTTLRGWLYTPDNAEGPSPIVVATHGWACVKEQALDILGDALAEVGVAALIYDHRNTGASDGPIRGHLDPWEQIHDYRHALTYVASLDEVDSDRIGIWGTSFSGGHVGVVAALDRRVKAAAVQAPLFGGLATVRRLMATMAQWDQTMDFLEGERSRWAKGEKPATIAVTAADPDAPQAFQGKPIYDFFSSWGDEAPNWDNEVTVMSIDLLIEYDPTPYLEQLGTTPILFVLGENDMTTPPDLALDAYRRVSGEKELVTTPGDHYSSYTEYMPYSAQVAADFFARKLRRVVPAAPHLRRTGAPA